MQGSIDYAGLFPPAGLGMTEAVTNYRHYAAAELRWMLGRFVVPVARLAEFQTVVVSGPPSAPWKVSALAPGSLPDSIPAILAFNAHVRDAQIDCIEGTAAAPDAIGEQASAIPDGLTVYWEIPHTADPAAWIEAIARAGHRAKIRSGGLREELFPTPEQVARFIAACDAAGVPFKATAGLHHAVPGPYPLTYEPGAAACAMHGFLNVLLAACFRWAGIAEAEMAALLQDGAEAFRFSRRGVAWRHHWIGNAQIQSARERLATSFGSCSFDEPVAELAAMRLL